MLVSLLIVIPALFVVSVMIYFLMQRKLNPSTFEERKDFIDLFTKIIGTLMIVVSFLFSWYNTDNTLQVSTRTLEVTQRREFVERFAKAVEQLDSDKPSARIGAVRSLERLANDAEDYHWPVMQSLASFLKERSRQEAASAQPRADYPADMQAALEVIGWRTPAFRAMEDQKLDLKAADLRGVDLRDRMKGDQVREGAHFENVVFEKAKLDGAKLRGAHFEGAFLTNARLVDAEIFGAHLDKNTDFNGANLKGADLGGISVDPSTIKQIKTACNWLLMKAPPKELREEWELGRRNPVSEEPCDQ